ncbi:DNA primase [Patescibacteria group bacterium]|nr:DNA primase [Patescibacteria group bacterium]
MGDIDDVKSRINIVEVIGERVKLKKSGRHFTALCPFHSEKTPSFIVSPERNIWKCFGCGKGGSVIDFVMEYDHVDFPEALEELAVRAGVKLERRVADTPEGKKKEKLYEVNHMAGEFYHFILTRHRLGERARQYLKTRGLSDKTIVTFGIGYSPNSWDALTNYLRKKNYDTGVLAEAGLLVPSRQGGYDRFRGRVMFPLRDHRGQVAGFSGRLLDPDAKEAKYINTTETPVYSKSNMLYGLDVTHDTIREKNQAILMEGEFDVISSFQAGVGNAVAIKGSALTEGHVRLIRRFAGEVVFALDSDLAGDAASRRGIEIADHAGLEMRVAVMPSGKDPDEAVRENPLLFTKAIKDAVPVYDYLISSAVRRFGTESAYGKKKIGDELLPVLSRIENSIVQGHYVKILSGVLGVSEEVVAESLRRSRKASELPLRGPETQEKRKETALTRLDRVELLILSLMLQGKTYELLEELRDGIPLPDFTSQPIRRILEALLAFAGQERVFLIKDFADKLPNELVPTLDEAFLWDLGAGAEEEERRAAVWNKAMTAHRYLLLRSRIRALSAKVREEAGENGDADTPPIREAQEQLRTYTRELKTLENSMNT